MTAIYQGLRRGLPVIMRNTGARSAFEASVFADLIVLGKALTSQHLHREETERSVPANRTNQPRAGDVCNNRIGDAA